MDSCTDSQVLLLNTFTYLILALPKLLSPRLGSFFAADQDCLDGNKFECHDDWALVSIDRNLVLLLVFEKGRR